MMEMDSLTGIRISGVGAQKSIQSVEEEVRNAPRFLRE
jgi:hypothetical protein